MKAVKSLINLMKCYTTRIFPGKEFIMINKPFT